jgi:hypothetical protein
LEEFAPEIVYIKGIHNTVADAISCLDYNPVVILTSEFNYSTFGIPAKGETMVKWNAFSKLWHCDNKNNPGNEAQKCNLNEVFANRSKEEEIFPLTTPEIAVAQKAVVKLKHCFRCNAILDKQPEIRLVDDTYMVCKDGKMIVPKPLQRHAVLWYHHYLQHPGHTQLKDTMKATMYWKGMRTSIQCQHFTKFLPHIPIVLDHTKELPKFIDIIGRIECKDCLHLFWLWFNSTSGEDVS